MLREGTTLVEVRALTPAAPDTLTRAAELPPPDLYIQAGAFADRDNAEKLLEKLRAAGLPGAAVLSPVTTQSHLYRVRVGPITSVAQFDELSSRLNALGIANARLAPD
jgi:rare lipoprotein A